MEVEIQFCFVVVCCHVMGIEYLFVGLYLFPPCMSAFPSPSPLNLNFEAKNILLNISLSPSAGCYHH